MRKNVNAYLMYMWNNWCPAEAQLIFDGTCYDPDYIWKKWECECYAYGSTAAAATFWTVIDSNVQDFICTRAEIVM